MTRSEVNEATVKFLAKGGKITRLPDGPDFRFQPYGARVERQNASTYKVDLTATEDPGSKKQIKEFEEMSLK